MTPAIFLFFTICPSVVISFLTPGFKCRVRCIAACLEDKENTSLETCEELCIDYGSNSLCERGPASRECWLQCSDLVEEPGRGILPGTPTQLVAVLDPQNATKVYLSWKPSKHAHLYVLQYRHLDDPFATWDQGGLGILVSIKPKSQFLKDSICSPYGFRVAGVNRFAIGRFSGSFGLPKARPILPEASLAIRSAVFLRRPFKNSDQESIVASLEYTPPSNWKNLSDLVPYLLVETRQCANNKTLNFTTEMKRAKNQIKVAFPSSVLKHGCTVHFTLLRLKSEKCGVTAISQDTGSPYLRLHNFTLFTCSNVRNAPCGKGGNRISPACGLANFSWSLFEPGGRVEISWTLELENWQNETDIKYHVIRWAPLKILQNHRKTNRLVVKNRTTAILSGLESGKEYGIQICAVFDAGQETRLDEDLELMTIERVRFFQKEFDSLQLDLDKNEVGIEAVAVRQGSAGGGVKWWVWVVVGSVMALVTLILVGVLISVLRSRRESSDDWVSWSEASSPVRLRSNRRLYSPD